MRTTVTTAVAMLGALGAATLAPTTATAQSGPVQGYRAGDEAAVARNILPPGQGGHLNGPQLAEHRTSGGLPEHFTDQHGMYEDLVAAAPDLTEADLDTLFKDASFGVPEDQVTERLELRGGGAVILRDGFHVPHVYGTTREDVAFGAGYASAQDRLFMMDVLRHLGRARLAEFAGPTQDNLEMDRAQFKLADYTEEELAAMVDRVAELDPELGELARGDVQAYLDGVNTYVQEALVDPTKRPAAYEAIQQEPEPWTITDVVAVASVIGGDFSPGGGDQLANAALLRSLEAQGFTSDEARTILADLRMADDPEAPTTTDERFPFLDGYPEPDSEAVVVPDDPQQALAIAQASLRPPTIDGPFGPIRLAGLSGQHSNALLVGSELSATGQALAVMGPQVEYWAPEILMELDLHGPGFHARGAAFPGISLYVLLGRGQDYAWSATTANGDHRDIRAVPLCEPDGSEPTLESTHYLDDAECVAMYTRTEPRVAKPNPVAQPENPTEEVVYTLTTERTRHGIVQGRALVDGEPWAFALQRSSYGKEVDATLTYTAIHDPDRVDSIDDLRGAFRDFFSYSFNWFLVHGDDIAFQLTGHYPIPPDGVDLDLPMHGGSRWDPRETLPKGDIAHVVNPDKGFITNWNGKQAPGWRAADAVWEFGPTQRVMLLDDGVEAGLADDGKVDLVELTRAMALGATRDLYGAKVLPLFLDVVGDPGDPRLKQALDLLADWQAVGAHRRDLDGDGEIETEAPVVLFDAWWPKATRAVFEPVLGEAFDDVPIAISERAQTTGSSYSGGWHGQLDKDLRQVLGRPVTARMSRTYCGEGDLAACRQSLLDSLDAALTEVEEAFGTDPATWDFDESTQDITFEEVGAHAIEPMHWQNRPTFQQVLAFGEPRPEPRVVEDEPDPAPLPATGGGVLAVAGAVLLAATALVRRRR